MTILALINIITFLRYHSIDQVVRFIEIPPRLLVFGKLTRSEKSKTVLSFLFGNVTDNDLKSVTCNHPSFSLFPHSCATNQRHPVQLSP